MFEFERMAAEETIEKAWLSVKTKNGAGGCDHMSIGEYEKNVQENLCRLRLSLTGGLYAPYREMPVQMEGRTVYLACVEDKIVQSAVALVLKDSIVVSENVHGFVPGRSVFTAHDALRQAIKRQGAIPLLRTDIDGFYASIDKDILIAKLNALSGDRRFISLIKMFLDLNNSGISAGSCLSPILSNIYLADFDERISARIPLYIRYVDDMILACEEPEQIMRAVTSELAELRLSPNRAKTCIIPPRDEFEYLGMRFANGGDDIDSLIEKGDFARAETFLDEAPDADDAYTDPSETLRKPISLGASLEGTPPQVAAVAAGCGIIARIIEKAETERYLTHQERRAIAYSFACLGEDGSVFVHRVMSHVLGYDYEITQRRLDWACKLHPIGCRKLMERFTYLSQVCACRIDVPDMYPSPICHAIALDPGCYHEPAGRESLGHFRDRHTNERLDDIVKRFAELNMKQQEIKDQQHICNEQIGLLFERTGASELTTSLGTLIKAEDGYFLKLG
jgi:hypothetical protein